MARKTAGIKKGSVAVVGVTIRKLFGYLDYTIKRPKTDDAFTKMIIFYGLNGTGKTTILRLIYHLLSSRDSAGHKSFIARTRFQLFQVTLSNGTKISASRPSPTKGTFKLTFTTRGASPMQHVMETVDEPPTITSESGEKQAYYDILARLRSLGLAFYYLADDRTFAVESDLFPRRRALGYEGRQEWGAFYHPRGEPEAREPMVQALEGAMSSFNTWISRQASYHSSKGVGSTHSVYAEVIKRIVTGGKRGRPIKRPSLAEQIEELRSIASDSSIFEQYGLSAKVDVRPLIATIKNSAADRQRIARHVLTPYVEALNLRFSELRPLYQLIHTLITDLNRFLKPKSVTFRVQDGLLFFSPTGDRLTPEMLSSGEKHLLLITCIACLATMGRGLFIVDEPEISLNVVWQRKLLKTLLEISRGSAVQFLFASHSISLITQHREHVAELLGDEEA